MLVFQGVLVPSKKDLTPQKNPAYEAKWQPWEVDYTMGPPNLHF